MKASDWILIRERLALRRGAWMGGYLGCAIGIALMIAVHLALSMRADAIHESAQASIREADRILGGDGTSIKASATECRELVERVAEEKYEIVRGYSRQIDELQRTATNAR